MGFDRTILTRRAALARLASAAAAASVAPFAPDQAHANFALELEPALRSHTAKSGIRFGCAGASPNLQADSIMLVKMATEANIFIPEAHLKWEFTEPRPNEFDFEAADSIVDFAERHDMVMHGHTLVWYAALPPWALQIQTAQEARRALERHITKLVTRYRGKVWAWDVVNEPIEPKDGIEGGYRNSSWFRLLGIDHVDLAFRLARAADPATPLCLNEYGFEYISAVSGRRRRDILTFLRRLRDLNTPVDIFGLQSHLNGHEIFDRKELTAFLKEVVSLGYKLMVTELDVNDVQLRGNEVERDAAVDRHVDEYLDIVCSVARPASISTWGLTDRYTWLVQYYKRADGQALRPLPLDRNFNRKRVWSTLAKYLSA